METKAKKKTFNIIMVALIVIIAGCGVMLVGHIQGWFGGGSGGSDMVSEEITGIVNVERSGVGYTLDKGVAMQPEDIVETKSGSEAVLKFGNENALALNEKTELEIPACEDGVLGITLNEGEIFAAVPDAPASFTIGFGENTANITGTVFSLSQRAETSNLCVYEGSISVKAEDGSDNIVEAGQELLITRNSKDKLTVDTSKIKASSLSDYMIGKLLGCGVEGLCFSDKKLNSITAAREKERQEAAKALEDEAIQIAANEESTAQQEVGENSGSSSGSNSGSSGSSSGGSSSASSGSSSSGGSDSSGGSSSGGSEPTKSTVKTCTISIQCKTILKNMDKLKEGKNRYVPANGIILATSSVEFRDGETAYDVTKRACAATGIQIEASYSPIYGSYYVEGINHLYEFDCGEMSGWLYKVNGWAPNYGCSEYTLKNGDSIVWTYTCTGN